MNETALVLATAAAGIGVFWYLKRQTKKKRPILPPLNPQPPLQGCTFNRHGGTDGLGNVFQCSSSVLPQPSRPIIQISQFPYQQISDFPAPGNPVKPDWTINGKDYWWQEGLN